MNTILFIKLQAGVLQRVMLEYVKRVLENKGSHDLPRSHIVVVWIYFDKMAINLRSFEHVAYAAHATLLGFRKE